MSSYWNYEDSDKIICPYCGEEYEPSYGDTFIGGESVNCYTKDKKKYTCDACGKKFTMYGHQAGWMYYTETIKGQATDDEIEDLNN